MADTKILCAHIPIALHDQVNEERKRLDQTTSEYITNLIRDYYIPDLRRTLPAHQATPGT